MRSIKSIPYKGISIIYTDASGMKTDDALILFRSTVQLVGKLPPKSVLSLINLEGVELSRTFNAELKSVAEQNSPYIKATAICGLSTMASFIAKSIMKFTKRNARLFNDIEEAKVWLHSESRWRMLKYLCTQPFFKKASRLIWCFDRINSHAHLSVSSLDSALK